MIQTVLVMNDGRILQANSVTETADPQVKWFWVNFAEPTHEEVDLLSSYFHFHELAVEDCLNQLQRPKIDNYGDYRFFVLHSFPQKGYRPHEINLFVAQNFIVSFHMKPSAEMDKVWSKFIQNSEWAVQGTDHLLYRIVDQLVDQYFPIMYHLDDELEDMQSKHLLRATQNTVHRIFRMRRELYALRRSLEPFREVVKEIMQAKDPKWTTQYPLFYADVHDHLTRLLEMSASYLQMGKDLQESYASLSSDKMNRVMVTLTIITTIFMPLTFIAGIYGMNFENMPELKWVNGYYLVLTVMAVIAVSMVIWFRRRGWFK